MVARKSLIWAFVACSISGFEVRADQISNAPNWAFWMASHPGAGTTAAQGEASLFSAPAAPSIPAPTPTPPPPQAAPLFTPQASEPILAPAPPAAVGPATGSVYDAFVNLGVGPYLEASAITTGNAQPWFNSPQIVSLFGGQPNAQQQADFANAVMQRVEQAFQLSGVPVTLTDNPNLSADHTLSLVSNTAASLLPSAIGMTEVGGSGFSFIDQEARSAQSLDQLEWIVAHNIGHELMLAFGVGENYDQSGNFIDARNANWAMITNPSAKFSPAAAQALNQALLSQSADDQSPTQLAQVFEAQTVPEPTTLVLWALVTTAVIVARPGRRGRASA